MKKSAANQSVQARVERLTLPTYPALDPDPNPMFFDLRDIQRSKGNIYPNPFTDQLSSEKVDRDYEAVYLENEFIEVVLIPELGGRIFAGKDKTNQYDFFYRHKVIKPALIGLLGPWISGGVEFNWPQHHRPSTFMPTDFSIEESPDGSKTVWMGEHDPLNRTKGMVGVCLHPGKAVVETKVRLYNRTPVPQTFLWWANAGVKINDHYQVIFPPDVHYSVFHTKQFVTEYPIAKGEFAGNDYGEGTDVSYWVNSYGATSFFAAPSKYSFFGGYDHECDNGVIHVANRHISPGKKFFTWANGPFGHTWQKNLMDDTGEYLELMAGVYTDNQPDFSWIMPYETKTFSQFWFPIQKIGGMKNANTRAAVNLEVQDGKARIGVYGTEVYPQAKVTLTAAGNLLLDVTVDLMPGKPYLSQVEVPAGIADSDLLLKVNEASGVEVIRYAPEKPWDGELPEPYEPPAKPEEMESVEDLFLTGLHLDQYRHPAIDPEPYWLEGLRRDPGESNCNIGLGKRSLRRGKFSEAEEYFKTAVKRLTLRNLNPYNGEAHYQLGLTLKYQGRLDEAYDAAYKAIWNHAWQAAGYYLLAQVDCLRQDYLTALDHLTRSLETNSQSLQARDLKSAVLRRLGCVEEAKALAAQTLELDPLDYWARWELIELDAESKDDFVKMVGDDPQTCLDIALDYAGAGLWQEAVRLLETQAVASKLYPMVGYTLCYLYRQMGEEAKASEWAKQAQQASPDYCFPARLDEMLILEDVLRITPDDARASYYLGNLLYDKKRYDEAVRRWKDAVRLEPGLAIPWRNLGLAAYNLDRDLEEAQRCFEQAFAANPDDPRILFELDQLLKRKGCAPEKRLEGLEARLDLVNKRDDLCLERAAILNRLGKPQQALDILTNRQFHPWEGGEGQVSGQYCNAHWLLGRQALETGDADTALHHFMTGLEIPQNLGEVPYESEIAALMFYAGETQTALGNQEEAQKSYERVLALHGGWGGLSVVSYYQALALRRLGHETEASQKLRELLMQSLVACESEPEVNYFYLAMPSPVFEDDLKKVNQERFTFLAGMAHLGLGEKDEAKASFEKVLALNPANLPAHEEYRRIA